MELSVEGPLVVIVIYFSQTSRFGTRKRIQNPVKHLGWRFLRKWLRASSRCLCKMLYFKCLVGFWIYLWIHRALIHRARHSQSTRHKDFSLPALSSSFNPSNDVKISPHTTHNLTPTFKTPFSPGALEFSRSNCMTKASSVKSMNKYTEAKRYKNENKRK